MQKEVIFMKKRRNPLKVIGIIVLTFVLVFTVSAGTLASALYIYMKNIDAELDIEKLAGNLGLTTKIYYTKKDGEEAELLRLHGTENRIWADIENISPNLQKAFIAIEDHRFYEHKGVDVKRTLWYNLY